MTEINSQENCMAHKHVKTWKCGNGLPLSVKEVLLLPPKNFKHQMFQENTIFHNWIQKDLEGNVTEFTDLTAYTQGSENIITIGSFSLA